MPSTSRNGSTWQWRKTRLYVLRRDKGICWICGKPGANSVDHKIPLAKRGTNALDNLAAAHLVCNDRKGTTIISVQATGQQPTTSRQW